jgi:hypothetical protein
LKDLASKDPEKLKKTVWVVKRELQDDEFAAAFVSSGGLPILVDMCLLLKGNGQTYALAALSTALSYFDGLVRVVFGEFRYRATHRSDEVTHTAGKRHVGPIICIEAV